MRGDSAEALNRTPVNCACGTSAARQDEKDRPAAPRCHICRLIAATNPEWTAEQVTEAGARRWLELAILGSRAAAEREGGDATREADYERTVRWTKADGYDRIVVRPHGDGVLEAIARVLPDRLVMETDATKQGVFALKLAPMHAG